jgi:DNA-binding NtrC family response regulator
MANILAVDDDETIREWLHVMLRRKGHHVITASESQQGIECFRRERPHVTILDFGMPDMDGLAVLREIRAVDPQAPVIILTGARSDEREKHARELGFLGVSRQRVLPSRAGGGSESGLAPRRPSQSSECSPCRRRHTLTRSA